MYAKKVTLLSPKLLKQRRKKRIIFLSVFFSVIVFLLFITYFFFNLNFFLINDIVIKGNEVTESENIHNVVLSSISGKYFYLIPKNNKLIYPKTEIIDNIKKTMKRIEDISLNVSKNSLEIDIGERSIYGLWCKESKCYFMDRDGYLFSEAPNFSSGVYVVFEGVIFDDNPAGKYFLERTKIDNIDKLMIFLTDFNLKVSKVKVNTDKDVEIYLTKGFYIKVDLTKPLEDTIKILKALLSSKEFSKSVSDLSLLEYIDIRFGNKVFYKQRNMQVSSEY